MRVSKTLDHGSIPCAPAKLRPGQSAGFLLGLRYENHESEADGSIMEGSRRSSLRERLNIIWLSISHITRTAQKLASSTIADSTKYSVCPAKLENHSKAWTKLHIAQWYNVLMDKIDPHNLSSIKDYVTSLNDEQTAKDTHLLTEMMQRISGHEPKLWNVGTLGFDSYHYKYDSGREGDSFIIGFYPRKGKISIYLMDGTTRHAATLEKLGKHSISGYCIYIKQLSDVELSVLEDIIQQSYSYIKSLSQDGPINRILWQTEK